MMDRLPPPDLLALEYTMTQGDSGQATFVELLGDVNRLLCFFSRPESCAGHSVAIVLDDDIVAIFNPLQEPQRAKFFLLAD